MAVQPFYATGTATVTTGSTTVTGTGTAWSIGVVSGGEFSLAGFSVPIASIDSNTSLTLAYPWPQGSVTGPYAISLGNSGAASAIEANKRLAQFVAAMSEISPYARQLFDDADADEVLATLGATEVGSALLTAIDAAAARATLGAQRDLKQVDSFELGNGLSGDRAVYFDLHAHGAANTNDYSLRIIRAGGVNGAVSFINVGTGGFDFNGQIPWSGVDASLLANGNGYQRLPNGLILQWGTSTNASSDYAQAFNIAFPSSPLCVVGTTRYAVLPTNAFIGVDISNLNPTFFDIRKRTVTAGSVIAAAAAYPVAWMAVGI